MLGKSYFDLAQAIYRATNFDDFVDLLVAKVPHLIGADEVVVLEKSPLSGYSAVSDHGPLAKRLREKLPTINRLIVEHPIQGRVDFDKPGDLGFAMSDYTAPGDYKQSRFVQEVFGDLAPNEVLFGAISVSRRRNAYIHCYLAAGAFAFQARERFDAILLTARGVLDRMAALNVESSVRAKLLEGTTSSPMAVFAVTPNGKVFAVNHAAVALSETWWGPDEPTLELKPDLVAELDRELDRSWDNAVTPLWKDLVLDLGGGELTFAALPKLSGETLLLHRMAGPGDAEEAVSILTKRQREIMDWIAEGKTSSEAAIILGISPRTVEKHLEAVFQRLGVENRIAAMRRYLDLKRGI
ncbi:helix-turn-helix transcriptional regulator [Luteolibacter sp. GHJ8]|uniref:Helix-turn-helix transcriptional regulator n=1 Tax=Luteolibacter rhizosphaerae TaxID=2989719 RepID=A0ABT3FX72_9BACT|nr:helix-turn-helix transcriptional regulator [Luteolibacter rhizosphaerae]MCW1912162.1 helix-turn-helix transcriptional regulator [Luteolibacter rhizosphaerae]